MDHTEKINRWQQFAKSKGWKSTYPAPHEWIVIKLTGKECTPSFFWPSWILAILFGFSWGIFWAVFMRFTVWQDKTLFQIAVPSIICGFFFGIGMAAFHLYQKRKCGLTTWEEFINDVKSSPKRA